MPIYHCFATLKTTDGRDGEFDGVIETHIPVLSQEDMNEVKEGIARKFSSQRVTTVTIRSFTKLD